MRAEELRLDIFYSVNTTKSTQEVKKEIFVTWPTHQLDVYCSFLEVGCALSNTQQAASTVLQGWSLG